jgi:hypothetical protein
MISMSTITDQIKRNRERYGRKLEEARADNDLTSEAKARRIAPVYKEAKAVDSRLRAERLEGLRERVRTAEREAFKAPSMRDADPALVQLNYRNALDAVEGITDPNLLSRRLDRALLTGDAALAKATAWRANDLGAAGVVRKYMDTDEAASRKWTAWSEAYADVEQVERLGESLGFGDVPISEPPELRGLVREAS